MFAARVCLTWSIVVGAALRAIPGSLLNMGSKSHGFGFPGIPSRGSQGYNCWKP
jgi:hypothetical protein